MPSTAQTILITANICASEGGDSILFSVKISDASHHHCVVYGALGPDFLGPQFAGDLFPHAFEDQSGRWGKSAGDPCDSGACQFYRVCALALGDAFIGRVVRYSGTLVAPFWWGLGAEPSFACLGAVRLCGRFCGAFRWDDFDPVVAGVWKLFVFDGWVDAVCKFELLITFHLLHSLVARFDHLVL